MQLGSMDSISKVLNMMELLCKEVEPLCSSCMNPNFSADVTSKWHYDDNKEASSRRKKGTKMKMMMMKSISTMFLLYRTYFTNCSQQIELWGPF